MKNFISTLFGSSLKIVTGIILAIVIVFLMQNWAVLNDPTTITFFASAEYPFWVWLLSAFIIGGVGGYILNYKSKRQIKKSLAQQQKETMNLKTELDKHRNLTLTDDAETSAPATPENT